MKLLLSICLLLLAVSSTAAEIFRHVDEAGRVTYTDQPTDGMEPIVLESVNTLPATTRRMDRPQPPAPANSEPFAGYQSLTLAGIENDVVLHNPTEPVAVNARLRPVLQPGHTLMILHDGQPANSDNQASVAVPDITRGTHTFRAEVIDEAGKVLIRSHDLLVHVQRTSVLLRPGKKK